ncbi:hypothetical protein Htur_3769 [Haloterrigena turkmenica DSM 5511]|uniref:Uncharacterized protein n=1 Tax=Haloterrigena turkmenica (strain ATCC 51198 / DSM 5511 / JCM 9101 / NCIMB 13204 / VKM B-1734 / 4k) TaxID=543526 RepID=D2RS14_HALTV|nr:hypothetical protein [Haloterrigena turkmenica]ADB62631.1 hypothetical protein Htur_3769 [Haloterrigena turkmenica DSM 5511]
MSDSSRSLGRDRRTTNALLTLLLVTLAAGFLYVGEGTGGVTRSVAELILTTVLWVPIVAGIALVLSRG